MKKTRSSEEQMVKIMREADQAPVAEVAKKYRSATRRYTSGGCEVFAVLVGPRGVFPCGSIH